MDKEKKVTIDKTPITEKTSDLSSKEVNSGESVKDKEKK